jgi:hypothetical protein
MLRYSPCKEVPSRSLQSLIMAGLTYLGVCVVPSSLMISHS